MHRPILTHMAHMLMDYASGRHPTGMHDLPLCVCFRVCVYMLEGIFFACGCTGNQQRNRSDVGLPKTRHLAPGANVQWNWPSGHLSSWHTQWKTSSRKGSPFPPGKNTKLRASVFLTKEKWKTQIGKMSLKPLTPELRR